MRDDIPENLREEYEKARKKTLEYQMGQAGEALRDFLEVAIFPYCRFIMNGLIRFLSIFRR